MMSIKMQMHPSRGDSTTRMPVSDVSRAKHVHAELPWSTLAGRAGNRHARKGGVNTSKTVSILGVESVTRFNGVGSLGVRLCAMRDCVRVPWHEVRRVKMI